MSPRSRRSVLSAALVGAAVVFIFTPSTVSAQVKHNCSFCHDLHGGTSDDLKVMEIVEDLCWSCHDNAILPGAEVLRDGVPVAVPQNEYEVHDGAKHTTFSRPPTGCWDCHAHEGDADDGTHGTNLSMIPAFMATPVSDTMEVIFQSRGSDASEPTLYSFADGDEDNDSAYTGVCEVCHTETSNHQNGTNLPDNSSHAHERGRTCSDCHTHDKGFAGGGPCASCHDTGGQGTTGPNSRRAIIPELSRVSHHVGASYVDDDCLVCHDQSRHQQGNVRLWDVDSPDTLTSIVLAGNPLTSSTEAAKLSTFCLGCHDADGAGGAVPFSDLVTPPEIDATLWAASSHEGSPAIAGCYGNGTFGCHASAHGSEKLNLLAPAESAPNATTLYEEEEGFCLACHDSDGPASTDLKSAFDEPINWVQVPTGLTANPNLNDRHDVQQEAQARSGAVIECSSCHNPHTATSAQPFILDPDPSDGHVVGTDYYYYSASSDDLSEFCLDCHDGSFAPGTQDQSHGITDILTTWADDGMGARTGSQVDIRSNAGYAIGDIMPCWSCHTPHPVYDADQASTTLFSVVDTLLNKDGTAYLFFKGRKASDPEIFDYGITDNLNKADASSGGYWCNSCHERLSMTGKDNCYACHRHGDGGRF